MASLNEIAYNIRNLAYNGKSSAEENISIRQIKHWIHYHRAKILSEISKNGKGVPHECYQSWVFFQNEEHTYVANSTYQTYIDSLNSGSWDINVPSNKTLAEAGITSRIVTYDSHFGRDFLDRTIEEENDEFGSVNFQLPDLININGYGAKLSLRERQHTNTKNKASIPVPILSQDEYAGKRFNRFTNKNICGVIYFTPHYAPEIIENPGHWLRIGNLRSFLKSNTGTFGTEPIQYGISANLLLSNPTHHKDWDNDDLRYPFPEQYISDLVDGALKEVTVALKTIPDEITDGRDTTKAVQREVQR